MSYSMRRQAQHQQVALSWQPHTRHAWASHYRTLISVSSLLGGVQ